LSVLFELFRLDRYRLNLPICLFVALIPLFQQFLLLFCLFGSIQDPLLSQPLFAFVILVTSIRAYKEGRLKTLEEQVRSTVFRTLGKG
jgi:hypothetical protein